MKYLKYEEDINDLYGLESIQLQVLNYIFYTFNENKKVKVGDILVLKKIASPATLHAALKKLIDKNLIDYQTSKNSRAKYIELTNLGVERYIELANKAQKSE